MKMPLRICATCALAMTAAAWVSPAAADPGRGTSTMCYVWAHNPTQAINVPYSPNGTYSYNAVGRAVANLVTRTAVGTYLVTCKGVGGGPLFAGSGSWGAGGHVQVTAYGTEDADYCKVGGWATGGADFSATVRCYNSNGLPSDNRFTLSFLW